MSDIEEIIIEEINYDNAVLEIPNDMKSWGITEYGERWNFVLQGCYDFPLSIYPSIKNKWYKSLKAKDRSFMWLTLSPDKFQRNLDNTPENLNALGTWCENWFKHNPNMYNGYKYVVENGSKGDHLHVHAILDLKNTHKHAEKLRQSWNRTFPKNQLLTSVNQLTKAYKNGTKKGEYCYAPFTDPLILQDKLDYLVNEKKGCHQNLSDTGVRGSGGVLSDIILKTPSELL